MVCKFKRKQSKRITLKTKYKIKRKVKEFNRKQKKKDKKLHKKSKKDPGIPNDCPFKDQVLQEVEARRQRAEELKQQQKEERKQKMEERRKIHTDMSKMVEDAVRKTKDYEKNKSTVEEAMGQNNLLSERSLKSYCKEFRKVVEAADVILEVLDARDPLGSRCSQVENAVLNAGADKRLVLVLNKIDLIPKENLEKWLKYLRQEMPTVAFKASTQTQRHNLSQKKVNIEKADEGAVKTSACVGADMLMKLLGNYCRNKGLKTTIRVGVVGFPNVGKSSIINSLKRNKACNVGAKPGVTRTIQEVHLDKHIFLLDCPGLVLATGSSESAVALRNAIKVETLEDPIKPVEAILQRAGKKQLMLYYRLPDFNTVDDFLNQMAKRFGKMRKGGFPDTMAAARNLIQHWNEGRIKYFTVPPEREKGTSDVAFVKKMSEEFDLDSLISEEKTSFNRLLPVSTFTSITLTDAGFTEGKSPEEEMDIEQPSTSRTVVTAISRTQSRAASPVSKLEKIRARKSKCKSVDPDQDLNITLNKDIKEGVKKAKKRRKRGEKLAGKLSDKLEAALNLM